MLAATRVAKAALTDWQSGGESRGQRSAVEDVETYLPGARWRAVHNSGCLLHNAWSSGESRQTESGRREDSAPRYNHDSGLPGDRLSCGQLAAAICEGREQGCREVIAFFQLR